MTTVNLTLVPGTYVVGIDRPWFVSQSAVRSKLEKDYGVTLVSFFDRAKPPAIAALVHPTLDPHYDNDWDEWLVADYAGAPKTFPNIDKVWAWMVVLPLPTAPAAGALARQPAPSPAAILATLPPKGPSKSRFNALPNPASWPDVGLTLTGAFLGREILGGLFPRLTKSPAFSFIAGATLGHLAHELLLPKP